MSNRGGIWGACIGCWLPALPYDALCALCREYSDALTDRGPDGRLLDQRPLQVIRDEIFNRVPSSWMAL